jgi:hypothetical protein
MQVESGDPVRSRIAIEMQLRTVIRLQGCLMLSTERGCAAGHPLARASPDSDPSRRRLQPGKVAPLTSESAAAVGLRRRRRRPRQRQWDQAADHHDGVFCGSRGSLLTQVAEKSRRRFRPGSSRGVTPRLPQTPTK